MSRRHIDKLNKIVIYRVLPSLPLSSIDFSGRGYILEHSDENIKLFIQKGKKSQPQWISFIRPYSKNNIEDIFNVSSSFILLCKHNLNVYAIAGGYGYIQLNGIIDDAFSRNVALRMIKNKEVSGLSQRSMKGTVRQIFRAVRGYDPIFDRDNFTRILNSIEGKGEFEGRTFRVSGRSSLVLKTTKDASSVDSVIHEIEEILKREEALHFPKSYEEIKDTKLIDELNHKLITEFVGYWEGSLGRDNLYAEFRDPLIQFRCDKYTIFYNRKKYVIEDFDLDVIKRNLIEDGVIISTIDDLNKIYVTAFDDSGFMVVDHEKFINMLVCELKIGNTCYIKMDKRWYRILDEFQDYVDNEIKRVHVKRDVLPLWDRNIHKTEKDYNEYVAINNKWSCLDQAFIYIKGQSKIELCDIYDKNNNAFFHIKETWGCKSAYLFTQGVTSTEYYKQSEEFRGKCKEKWPDLFENIVDRGEIIFGIAAKQAEEEVFPLNMTYFSKLNLYTAIVLLKSLDFTVSLAPIKIINLIE